MLFLETKKPRSIVTQNNGTWSPHERRLCLWLWLPGTRIWNILKDFDFVTCSNIYFSWAPSEISVYFLEYIAVLFRRIPQQMNENEVNLPLSFVQNHHERKHKFHERKWTLMNIRECKTPIITLLVEDWFQVV